MAHPPLKEFRPYRLAFTAVAVAVISIGIAWIAGSAAVAAFGSPRGGLLAGQVGPATPPPRLPECRELVEGLARDQAMLAQLVGHESTDWAAVRQSDEAWMTRWNQTGVACGLIDGRPRSGPDHDRLAAAHRELGALHQTYLAFRRLFDPLQGRRIEALRDELREDRPVPDSQRSSPASSPQQDPPAASSVPRDG